MSQSRNIPLDVFDAIERVFDRRESVLEEHSTETMAISDLTHATLAEAIVADTDIPSQDFATMDGYAFDANDSYPLSIVDASVYPEDESPSIDSGEAVKIATGAPLPAHANSVLKREDAIVEYGSLRGDEISVGTYTYARGSNVKSGERLFESGECIGPKDALLLTDLGIETVDVYRPFSVGILATGTEIHEGRSRDLDTPMLTGLVRSWGHRATAEGSVPDTYEKVRDRIEELTRTHDVVMTTGGTSVGKKDYVVRALHDLGTVDFHRVNLRPGKPIAMATVETNAATVFAIPGKPVGAHLVTAIVARPFFTGSAALPTVTRTIDTSVSCPVAGFHYAIPVTYDNQTATPLGHENSELQIYSETYNPSVLSSSTRATRARGFVLSENGVERGEAAEIVPFTTIQSR